MARICCSTFRGEEKLSKYVTGVTVGTGLAGVLLASDVWDGSLGAGLAAVWSFATAVAALGVIGSRGLPGPRTVG